MHELVNLLAPFQRKPPQTALEADDLIDHLAALKEREPTNPFVDAALRGIGRALCDFEQPFYQH